MGLFDQSVGALADPNREASNNQLNDIFSSVQQIAASRGVSSQTTEAVLSVLGSYVRSALQQKRTTQGNQSVQAFVNQYGGTGTNPQAVTSLFSPQQQGQIAGAISKRTGIDAATVQSLLPALVPVVLNLLKTGTSTHNPQQDSNSVLSSFLDADRDGDVDLADAMRLTGQFLQNR